MMPETTETSLEEISTTSTPTAPNPSGTVMSPQITTTPTQ
jgi:hypothetical protein